jgi:Ubiquitin family/DUF2407 C-terminal domain
MNLNPPLPEGSKVVWSERNNLISNASSPNASFDDKDLIKPVTDSNGPLNISIKKNTTTETKTIDLRHYQNYTMEEFKRVICPEELKQEKQIRIIYQGKLIKPEDHIRDIKFKDGTFLHLFISTPLPAAPEGSNTTAISAELFEPERRGFDKFRPLDIMDEEIIMFRAKFHSKYIILADKNLVNENELYKQEDDWLRVNEQFLRDKDSVRHTVRTYGEDEEPNKGNILDFLIGLVLGIIANLFLLPFLVYSRERSTQFHRGILFGILLIISFFQFCRFLNII